MSWETKSCTVFDVSGLTEVKLQKLKGWQGRYFLDSSGTAVAKTCSTCKIVLAVDNFGKDPNRKYGYQSVCRPCRVIARRNDDRTEYNRDRAKKLSTRDDKQIEEDRNNLLPGGKAKCTSCYKWLEFDKFYKSRSVLSGLQGKCKSCQYLVDKKYRTTVLSDGMTGYQKTIKKYRQSLSNRSSEEIEADRAKSHPEGTKYCCRCSKVLEIDLFHNSRYMLDGLSLICKSCSRYRKTRDFADYWEKIGVPLVCYICGGPWEAADHVLSRKRGGSDKKHNRLPVCKSCNSSKNSHPLDEWLFEKYPNNAQDILHRVDLLGIEY